MATNLFDSAIVGNVQEAVDFISNILESSTEYSIIPETFVRQIEAFLPVDQRSSSRPAAPTSETPPPPCI
jgi:hypothetical protein